MGELVSLDSLGVGKSIKNKKKLGSGMTSAQEAEEGLKRRVKIGIIGGEMCARLVNLELAVSKDG